jgi:hypothetical protein
MESVLKVSKFSKIFKKRAWDTHNPPKPATEILAKLKNFNFCKTSFAGLGGCWVPQALFSKIFEKFENFKTLFIPQTAGLTKILRNCGSLKTWKKQQFRPKFLWKFSKEFDHFRGSWAIFF